MGQSPQNVITPEVDSDETTLPSPRFDEVAARMARPVVPLSEEVVSTNTVHTTNLNPTPAPLLAGNRSWLLAAVVCLILVAGAAAIALNAHSGNQVSPTQSLAPVAEAARVELSQYPRRGQSLTSNAPAIPKSPDAPAISKTAKRVRRARPAFDNKSKARMVDSYVIR